MAEISIQEVLSIITDTEVNENNFLIKVVRANKSRSGAKGSIKIVAKCRKGKPRSKRAPSDALQLNGRVLHIDRGTIPLVDVEKDQFFTPFISHIVGFNTFKVIH